MPCSSFSFLCVSRLPERMSALAPAVPWLWLNRTSLLQACKKLAKTRKCKLFASFLQACMLVFGYRILKFTSRPKFASILQAFCKLAYFLPNYMQIFMTEHSCKKLVASLHNRVSCNKLASFNQRAAHSRVRIA